MSKAKSLEFAKEVCEHKLGVFLREVKHINQEIDTLKRQQAELVRTKTEKNKKIKWLRGFIDGR